ncbi:MAG: hypothetical protein WCG27_10815 [Pseudomonadota bacterium]
MENGKKELDVSLATLISEVFRNVSRLLGRYTFILFLLPILLNIFLCSGVHASDVPLEEMGCTSLARELLPHFTIEARKERWLQLVDARLPGSEQIRQFYTDLFANTHLTSAEINILDESLAHFPEEAVEIQLLEDYLLFTRTRLEKERDGALRLASKIFHRDLAENEPLLREFFAYQSELDNYFKGRLGHYQKRGENGNSEKLAWIERQQFRNIYNGCHTMGKTPEHRHAAKVYTAFTAVSGVTLAMGAWSYSNRDFWNNDRHEFWKRFRYNFVQTIVWRMISAFCVTKDSWSMEKKFWTFYKFDNVLSIFDGYLWKNLITKKDKEAEQVLGQLRQDINFRETIDKLTAHIDHHTFKEEFLKQFRTVMKKFMTSSEVNDGGKPIDWGGLKPEDLDRPEVSEQLMQMVLMDFYKEKKGQVVATGDSMLDRYLYYSFYGLFGIGTEVYISHKYIYQAICMAKINPVRYYAQASIFYVAMRLAISYGLEYPYSKWMINQ